MIQLYQVREHKDYILWTPFPDGDGSEIVSLYESKIDGRWTASLFRSWVDGTWASSDEAMNDLRVELLNNLWDQVGRATRDFGRARGLYR